MQTEPIKILCCGDPGKDSIAEASKYAIDITVHEFSTIVNAVDPTKKNRILELAKKKSTVVFTSKNGVAAVIEALGTIRPLWNIYCIGGPTQKEVIGYFGADKLKNTAINALELAKIIAENGVTEIVFFCGNLRRQELPDFLHERNMGVEELVVYDTIPKRKKLDDEYDGILFFNPSAVDTFFLDNTVSAKTLFFVIGSTTASALKSNTTNRIFTNPVANKNSLVKKVIDFFLYPTQKTDLNEYTAAK